MARDSERTLLFVVNVGWFFLSHRLPLAIAARTAGYRVHVACDVASADEVARIEAHGLQFHRLTLRRGSANPLSDLTTLRELVRLCRLVHPDVMHLVTLKPVIYGTLAARMSGVRGIVSSISGLGSVFVGSSLRMRMLRPLVRFALGRLLCGPSGLVIVQNADDMRQILADGTLPAEQVVLIRGSGVDLNLFRPTPEPAGTPRVLLPARVLRDKGVVEFAHAARLVRSRGVDAQFLIAGALDTDNPSALTQSEIEDLERSCGVQWIGHVTDMPALLASCQVVCLPSYREGLPKALLEAAAAGRAIVTTDVPGCREIVQDRVTGLLVPPRAVEPLADTMERVLTDEPLRRSLAAAARAAVEREFSLDSIVVQTLRAYERAAGTTPAASTV